MPNETVWRTTDYKVDVAQLAFYEYLLITDVKSFIILHILGIILSKHFGCNLRVFVIAQSGKDFQPSLMFVSRAGAYQSAHWVGSRPYPQALDKAGKACQGQIL